MNAREEQERLQRLLHAAADSIEPAGDGLARIKQRLRPPRPLPIAMAEAAWTTVSMRVPEGLADFWYRLVAMLATAWERFAPDESRGPKHASKSSLRSLRWVRPAAAMGTAVFIVAAGAYIAIEVPSVMSPSGSTSGQGGNGNNGNNGGQPAGSAQTIPGSTSPTPGTSTASPPWVIGGLPSPSCTPGASSSSPASSSPPVSTSPSSTASPSPSASPSSPDPSTSTTSAQVSGLGLPATANSATNAVSQRSQAQHRSSSSSSCTSPSPGKKKKSPTP